jgi:spore maturation protein CgeB
MKILFIGSLNKITYSYFSYKILKKNYKNIEAIDTDKVFFFNRILSIVLFHLNPKLVEFYLNYTIKKNIKKNYDLVFVVAGEFLGKNILSFLKKNNKKLIFLCLDNPFFNRDKKKWILTLGAINIYDLIIFQQKTRIKYAKKLKLKYALLPPLYNKNIHKPKNNIKNKRLFKRNVLVVGTWFLDRGKFIKKLIDLGMDLEIYGNRWDKDPNYSILKNFIKGKSVNGASYSNLIFNSKIVISLPNTHNDDDITNKSLEIPAVGSLLLTKDTSSHREIFVPNKEAVLFKDANDCYKKCNKLLYNEDLIKSISIAGHKKIVLNSKFDYEKNLIKLMDNFN